MPRSNVVKARVGFIVRDEWIMGGYHILLFVGDSPSCPEQWPATMRFPPAFPLLSEPLVGVLAGPWYGRPSSPIDASPAGLAFSQRSERALIGPREKQRIVPLA